MQNYEAPEMEIVTFRGEDVIETSGETVRFIPEMPEDWFNDSL